MRHNLTKFQRCPGCGNYSILAILKKVLTKRNISSANVVVVSGIGCSGKFSQHIETHGAETLHGRSLPFATGVKLADPSKTVIVYTGDGDTYGIGLNHFLQTCKRDVDLVHLVADNENYALTTGQTSPTTPHKVSTSSNPEGNPGYPLDPLKLATQAGCGFAHQVADTDIQNMEKILSDAFDHSGYRLINIKQSCPSFKKR